MQGWAGRGSVSEGTECQFRRWGALEMTVVTAHLTWGKVVSEHCVHFTVVKYGNKQTQGLPRLEPKEQGWGLTPSQGVAGPPRPGPFLSLGVGDTCSLRSSTQGGVSSELSLISCL